jgi:hypothetical protein
MLWSRTWSFWTGICSKWIDIVLVGIVSGGRQLQCCTALVMVYCWVTITVELHGIAVKKKAGAKGEKGEKEIKVTVYSTHLLVMLFLIVL